MRITETFTKSFLSSEIIVLNSVVVDKTRYSTENCPLTSVARDKEVGTKSFAAS